MYTSVFPFPFLCCCSPPPNRLSFTHLCWCACLSIDHLKRKPYTCSFPPSKAQSKTRLSACWNTWQARMLLLCDFHIWKRNDYHKGHTLIFLNHCLADRHVVCSWFNWIKALIQFFSLCKLCMMISVILGVFCSLIVRVNYYFQCSFISVLS